MESTKDATKDILGGMSSGPRNRVTYGSFEACSDTAAKPSVARSHIRVIAIADGHVYPKAGFVTV